MLSNGEHSSASHSLPGSKPLLQMSTDIKKDYASFISKSSARKKQRFTHIKNLKAQVKILKRYQDQESLCSIVALKE